MWLFCLHCVDVIHFITAIKYGGIGRNQFPSITDFTICYRWHFQWIFHHFSIDAWMICYAVTYKRCKATYSPITCVVYAWQRESFPSIKCNWWTLGSLPVLFKNSIRFTARRNATHFPTEYFTNSPNLGKMWC